MTSTFINPELTSPHNHTYSEIAEPAMEESDDDFERLSNFSDLTMSDAESDAGTDDLDAPQNTPATTPASSSSHQDLPRHRQKRFACTYKDCSKAFNRPALLEQHIRSHSNDRAFECPYEGCSKTYLRDSHLKHHVKSAHTKVRDYKCTWEGCDKSFITATRLKNHLAVHEGHEKFRCRGFGDCNQTFRKKDTLQRHVVAVHLGAKPFPCPENDCNKAFLTAEHLRQHQRVNHDPHRYSCEICLEAVEMDELLSDLGKRQKREAAYFANWTDFQIHNQEFHPPTCEHCNQSFQTNKQLTKHLESEHEHQDPKKISETPKAEPPKPTCSTCNKTFSSKSNLNAHVKIHLPEEERPIVCSGQMRVYEHGTCTIKYLNPGEEGPEGIDVQDVVGCKQRFNQPYLLARHIYRDHLGLKHNKRCAEEAELGEGGGKKEKKARAPRKDKGVIKKKLGSGLVDTADAAEEPAAAAGEVGLGGFDGNDSGVSPAPTTDSFPSWYRDNGYAYLDDLDNLDHAAPLTGSEVMVEGEVFTAYGRGGDTVFTSDYPTLD